MLLEVLHNRNDSFLARIEHALQRIPPDLRDHTDAESIATVLAQAESAIARPILERLDAEHAALAREVRRHMTSLEDVQKLDDRSVQVLLRELDAPLLAKALKGACPETREKVFGNMSRRAAEQLRQDMQALGSVRMAEVEEAQAAVAFILRRLESSGAVAVPRAQGGPPTP